MWLRVAYLLPIVSRLIRFESLVQFKYGIHGHYQDLIYLARDGVVDVLEVFCSASDARHISVQWNELSR